RPSYMPNPALTPGDAVEVTKDDLCGPGRHELDDKVPVAVKRQVFDRYAISPGAMGYNVDHLIPEKLGGSNTIKNLWPQPLSGKWTYNMKNRLENRLYKLVCSGTLELKTAQQEIVADWVSAYKKYIGESGQPPQSKR
ncbi:MAG TPA: HNH endonuclease, partial [Blastocatellia bacterium]|nr:HNH endonuclease [Blastocatellia bacterium]